MIDIKDMSEFTRKCEAAAADLKPYAQELVKQSGELFLDVVQDKITARGNVDTGRMLNSFQRGGPDNVFEISDDGFSIVIGSKVPYAPHVNYGHKQQPGRFIPGVWEGKHFRYVPGAKTGMVLKRKQVKGSKFFTDATKQMKERFPELVERSAEQFFRRYFS